MKKQTQNGSVVTYALIALFLTGLLIAAMTQGAKKNASSTQLNELMSYLQEDIQTIHTTIDECAQTYSSPVDVNGDGTINAADNPNPPFPVYNDLSNGGAGTDTVGTAVAGVKCPGAPTSRQVIFSASTSSPFKVLNDTVDYTTTYFNDGTEGVYIRITRATSDPLWTEAISRLNGKYAPCAAAAPTAAGVCVNGCFYYWIVRLPTSTLGGEAAQPTCG